MPIDLRKIDPELSYPLKEVAEFLDVYYGTSYNHSWRSKLDKHTLI